MLVTILVTPLILLALWTIVRLLKRDQARFYDAWDTAYDDGYHAGYANGTDLAESRYGIAHSDAWNAGNIAGAADREADQIGD